MFSSKSYTTNSQHIRKLIILEIERNANGKECANEDLHQLLFETLAFIDSRRLLG